MSNFFESIQHVSLIISNIERSKQFYAEVLGLAIDPNRPKMSSDGIWFNINSQQQIHLLLTDNPYKSVTPPTHAGLDRHVALRAKDFNAIKSRLDKYKIAYTLSKSGRNALFCRDPDKNILEIIE